MLNNEGITDKQGENRYAIVPGLTHHPRAGKSLCTSARNLFYEIDEQYPVLRVYDDHKYQVMELAYKEHEGLPTSYCPEGTFEYRGDCVTTCPNNFQK